MQHTRKEQMEAFGRFLDILDELRVKCPWDKKQTNESLRPNTIEETYELCDALIRDDKNDICKELGDVLLHVAFYLFLAGLAGGLAATISLAVTCFISNYFTDVAMAFLLSLIFNAFSAATTSALFSPNLLVIPVCPLYIPSLAVALSELLLGTLLFSLIYFYGVRRHVFS